MVLKGFSNYSYYLDAQIIYLSIMDGITHNHQLDLNPGQMAQGFHKLSEPPLLASCSQCIYDRKYFHFVLISGLCQSAHFISITKKEISICLCK